MSQPRRKEKTVRDVVPPDLEVVKLKAATREEAIRELVTSLVAHDVVDLDREREVRDLILEREGVASTGIGNGVALPHAKFKHAKKLGVVFGLSEDGIEFGAHDSIPAFVVVLWVCQPRQVEEHLALMRGLATVAKDANRAGELAAVRDRRSALEFLGTIPVEEKGK